MTETSLKAQITPNKWSSFVLALPNKQKKKWTNYCISNLVLTLLEKNNPATDAVLPRTLPSKPLVKFLSATNFLGIIDQQKHFYRKLLQKYHVKTQDSDGQATFKLYLEEGNENPWLLCFSAPTTVTPQGAHRAPCCVRSTLGSQTPPYHWAQRLSPIPPGLSTYGSSAPTSGKLHLTTPSRTVQSYAPLDSEEYLFCFTPFTEADIFVYLHCLVLIVGFILAQRSNASLQS